MSSRAWFQPSEFSLMYQTRVRSMSLPPAGSSVSARLWMNGAVRSEKKRSALGERRAVVLVRNAVVIADAELREGQRARPGAPHEGHHARQVADERRAEQGEVRVADASDVLVVSVAHRVDRPRAEGGTQTTGSGETMPSSCASSSRIAFSWMSRSARVSAGNCARTRERSERTKASTLSRFRRSFSTASRFEGVPPPGPRSTRRRGRTRRGDRRRDRAAARRRSRRACGSEVPAAPTSCRWRRPAAT